jgi:protoheme ferro-lyase
VTTSRALLLVTPGFVSDCLETLEEWGIGAVEQLQQAGGERFVVPCLNADVGIARPADAAPREETPCVT